MIKHMYDGILQSLVLNLEKSRFQLQVLEQAKGIPRNYHHLIVHYILKGRVLGDVLEGIRTKLHAMQKVLNKNREHGDVEREKRRGRAEMIRCQREEEKLKREDLIRRIRALERAPRKTAKVFDPTKSSGIGLLDEMSLVELYERLEIVKAQARRDCERVRMRAAEEKRARQDDLKKRLENIGRLRMSARVANKAERERRRQMKLNAKIAMEKHREQSKRDLARKLAARREALSAEFDALKQEELRVEKQRLLLGSNKLVIQQRHFKEQIKGAEREARIRQHVAQEDARRAREFAAKDRIFAMIRCRWTV